MTDANEEAKLYETLCENVRLVNKGWVNPLFADLPELAEDSTSPLTQTADDLAAKVANVVVGTSTQGTPNAPGKDEIMAICALGNCPVKAAEGIAERYNGKVTWDDYQSAVSGNMSPADIKKLAASWKLRT